MSDTDPSASSRRPTSDAGNGGVPPGWRQAFSGLTETPTRAYTPAALGFELVQVVPRTWSEPKHTVLLRHQDVTAGIDPNLAVRPLHLSDSGNWVKTSMTWRGVDRFTTQFGIDPVHQEWFAQFAGLRTRDRTDFSPDSAPYNLGDFHAPMLWQFFARAQALGIEFVGINQGLSVALGRTAVAEVDIQKQRGHLRVQSRVSIDEREYLPGLAKPIWTHGFFGVELRSDFRVTLAPAAKPTSAQALPVFASPLPIDIPNAEAEEFFEEYYPLLRTSTHVVSADESVTFPHFSAPRLVLFQTYKADDVLELRWYWEYSGPRRTLPIRGARPPASATGPDGHPVRSRRPVADDHRDIEHENTVLAEVERRFPTGFTGRAAPGRPAASGTASSSANGPAEPTGDRVLTDQTLREADTADFVVNALPDLELIEHLRIITRGKKQPYRELGGEPNIRITAVESEKNDWFDLGFQITVDGRPIPFVKLFTALARGAKKLKLSDNTFMSLTKPVFDRLKALLSEADLIPEWEPESPKITRLHAGLWSDFVDLADESAPARSWRDSAEALVHLDTLPEVPVPPLGGVTLRPYQVQGFRWLALLHRCRLGGVLADDMGLGKTLQTLALIAHAKSESQARATAPEPRPETTGDDHPAGASAPGWAPFLVVAPTSVVPNWAAEAAKFTPELDVRVVKESSKKRKKHLAEVADGADVVVMSYAMLRLDEEQIASLPWSGFVLDEAQFVKNPSSQVHLAAKSVNAPFRLALTGTPMENSLRDIWALFSITAPGLFPSPHRFDEEYVRPIEGGANPGRMQRLQRRIHPFMMRRTKDLVAKDLPDKQEQVVTVELNPAHRKLYDRILQKERKKILGFIDSDYDRQRFIVFRSLTLLRMLALDPRIVDVEHEGVMSSKLAAMLDRLDDVIAEGHRSIVFSQFTSFLDRVAEELDRRGVPYVLLDGSTKDRGRVVEEFRNGDAPVFLISLKAGGFGLTLTEADYVFLMDPWWNPAAENQAIDRAHRIGQTKNVMVYRYVAEGTVEEKVLGLQQKKAKLFDALMSDGTAFEKAVTAADIKELFAG